MQSFIALTTAQSGTITQSSWIFNIINTGYILCMNQNKPRNALIYIVWYVLNHEKTPQNWKWPKKKFLIQLTIKWMWLGKTEHCEKFAFDSHIRWDGERSKERQIKALHWSFFFFEIDTERSLLRLMFAFLRFSRF